MRQPPRSGWTTTIMLAVLLLLGGGGVSAYLMLRKADGPAAGDPRSAVTQFLAAVYTEQDARRAAALVCPDARNQDSITRKIDEITGSVRRYRDPRFSWDEPRVEDETSDRARVTVTITLTTGDDRIAEQRLGLTVVREETAGWWVCEVESR